MALLTILPHEQKIITELFNRLCAIDFLLMDFHISWDETKRLLQERTEIQEIIRKLGYEP